MCTVQLETIAFNLCLHSSPRVQLKLLPAAISTGLLHLSPQRPEPTLVTSGGMCLPRTPPSRDITGGHVVTDTRTLGELLLIVIYLLRAPGV